MGKTKKKKKHDEEVNGNLPVKKKKVNVRRKGHSYERDLVLIFKALGFENVKTSRYASKLLDDCKVDLANIPLNIQAKSGYWNNRPKPEIIFKEMRAHLESNFPPGNPQRDYPKVLFHKLDGQQNEHQLVVMMFHEWMEIYKNHLKWLREQEVKNI